MSGSQPDQAQALQDFYALIRRELTQSYDVSEGASSTPRDQFIPIDRLETAFQENNCRLTRELLRVIYPHGELPVRPKDVAEQCCRGFCILLLIGQGRFIQTFSKYPNLADIKLPFIGSVAPEHFPFDSSNTEFYHQFYEEQWKFYAPELHQRMGVRFEQPCILPFEALSRTGGGFTSTVYRAVIHAKHDKLNQLTNPNHYYAIKTYKKRGGRQNYEKESEAFRKITESGIRQTPGIIGFYGSFEYRGSFNLLLEYADGGTLEEFFNRDKPSGGANIIDFWKAMFEVIKGIFWLHDHHLPVDPQEDGHIQQGWHQDLKPSNILVLTSDAAPTYQGLTFKITDFGLSHFKTIMEGRGDSVGLDTKGTRTYGAPETYSESSFAEYKRHNWIKRSVDVWSLGCIFSEAATWVVEGHDGVRRYRRDRLLATGRIQGFRGGDCFHNGRKRLTIIDSHHLKLRSDLEYDDKLTGRVLDNMVEEMLEEKSETRPRADQLEAKAQKALTTAMASLERSATLGLSRQSLDTMPPGPSRLSLQLRTRAISGARNNIFGDERFVDSSPAGTMSLGAQRPPYQQPSPPVTPTKEPQQQAPTHGFTYPRAPGGDTANHPHDTGQGSRHNREISSLSVVDSVHPPPDPLPTQFLRDGDSQPIQSSPPELSPTFSQCSGCGCQIHVGSLFQHHTLCAEYRLKHQQSPELAPSKAATPTASRAPRIDIPTCTFRQAKAWHKEVKEKESRTSTFIKKIKGEDKFAKLPCSYLLDNLGERDHVFLVDDSVTMRQYWDEVQYLATLLTYLVKASDKDGVDLIFLSSQTSYNCKTSTQVGERIANHRPKTETGLDDRFSDQLGSYGRLLNGRVSLPKKRSIYVLTDGILPLGEDNQGQEAVRKVVDRLLKADAGKGQLGIQLISFGDNEAGLKLLAAFDVFAPQGLDIVDTEPSDGNVWKMLLGSINKVFDGDDPKLTPTTSG